MKFGLRGAACLVLFGATLCLFSPSAAFSKDPYKVLGVEKDSDEAAIKKAYKKLALKYHPDKNPKGQAKFIEIQQAYEILSDSDKKRQYDLGGSYDGDHQESRYYRQQHAHQQQYQYQQHYQHYYQQQQYQQQQEQMHDRALPSNTSFLTTSNFRNLVFYGARPWLMMVYLEDSAACREFSPTWEALWRSLGGSQAGAGNRDGASVGLGRIHARYQRSLVHWISKAMTGRPFQERDLPVLIGVPNGCTDAGCFVRYRGPLRLTALQDFVADQLLHLPKVPQLEPATVPAFLRRASPYTVVVVAFGRGGGSGSLTLRTLAGRQKDMLTVARGHVQEDNGVSAAAWQAALGLSGPPASGTVVFLRGPGTTPRVLTVPPGKAGDLPRQIEEHGLLWQEVPPLRPSTGSSLGCLWGRAAAASGRSMIDTCVVVIAPRGPALEEARRRMAALGHHLAMAGAQRDVSLAASSGAYLAGKLRLAWLDATVQRRLCNWALGTAAAMRPTNTAPPPGTNAAGRAAAAAQAKAAAAAKSPDLVRGVCGSAPLDVLGRAREVAAAAADAARLPQLAKRLRPRPAAHLLVFRPSVDGSSWMRSGHMRNGRHAFLFAVNADFDLGAQERSVDADLVKLAIWVNQMHVDPDRHLHASAEFPPEMVPDNEPSVLEFIGTRLSSVAQLVVGFIMTATGMDDVLPGGSGMQAANVLVLVTMILLLQLALWWRGDGGAAARATNNAAARRRAAATAGAQVSPRPAPAPTDEATTGRPDRRSRSSFGSRRSSEGHADGPAEDGAGRRRERVGPQNRRALSPSWQGGRRGDARDSDGEKEGPADGTAGAPADAGTERADDVARTAEHTAAPQHVGPGTGTAAGSSGGAPHGSGSDDCGQGGSAGTSDGETGDSCGGSRAGRATDLAAMWGQDGQGRNESAEPPDDTCTREVRGVDEAALCGAAGGSGGSRRPSEGQLGAGEAPAPVPDAGGALGGQDGSGGEEVGSDEGWLDVGRESLKPQVER